MNAQQQQADSTLSLYRQAVALRRSLFNRHESIEWVRADDAVLAFSRGDAQCWINTGNTSIELPAAGSVVLSSQPLVKSRVLPPDTAAWLTAGGPS